MNDELTKELELRKRLRLHAQYACIGLASEQGDHYSFLSLANYIDENSDGDAHKALADAIEQGNFTPDQLANMVIAAFNNGVNTYPGDTANIAINMINRADTYADFGYIEFWDRWLIE